MPPCSQRARSRSSATATTRTCTTCCGTSACQVSTAVQLGPGPYLDDIHVRSLRAALLDGGPLELTEPGESEDFGRPWDDPRSLTEFGTREATEPWTWGGPGKAVSGPSWGGCIEVIDQIAIAGRMPKNADLDGAILMLETSEETPSADEVKRW